MIRRRQVGVVTVVGGMILQALHLHTGCSHNDLSDSCLVMSRCSCTADTGMGGFEYQKLVSWAGLYSPHIRLSGDCPPRASLTMGMRDPCTTKAG